MKDAPRLDWRHAAAGLLALGLGALATAEEQKVLDQSPPPEQRLAGAAAPAPEF